MRTSWDCLTHGVAISIAALAVHACKHDPEQVNQDSRRQHEVYRPVSGDYYLGDGLGANWYLRLNETGYFSFTWKGCEGTYAKNQGPYEIAGDVLTLKPAYPFEDWVKQVFPLRLVIVPWGERTYLVDENMVAWFCEMVCQGAEPRKDIHGEVFMRQDDDSRSAGGVPVLPRDYVMPERTPAKVQSKDEGDLWTLNLGSKDGVAPGMQFCHDYHKALEFPRYVLKVIAVNPRTSQAKVIFGELPKAGDVVTSGMTRRR